MLYLTCATPPRYGSTVQCRMHMFTWRPSRSPPDLAETAARRRAAGRDDIQKKWITSDPSVMMGKPVITGTRITVELVLKKLAAGETVGQILGAHPRLTHEAVQAALAFAAEALRA